MNIMEAIYTGTCDPTMATYDVSCTKTLMVQAATAAGGGDAAVGMPLLAPGTFEYTSHDLKHTCGGDCPGDVIPHEIEIQFSIGFADAAAQTAAKTASDSYTPDQGMMDKLAKGPIQAFEAAGHTLGDLVEAL